MVCLKRLKRKHVASIGFLARKRIASIASIALCVPRNAAHEHQ